ncbi:hypothetical protein [Roseateles koreensis]|uniref:Uncharacterized protein n=1 Tax=Roseateles koreensis TaxID=2987526 RepID=A0ABT5KSL0_9BURK|nr:hypothetical protein [Roseateles koreensis]MDC8785899.1 hypothetical protein [Roseateles koreensis]
MWFKVKKPATVVPSEEVVLRYSLQHLAEGFCVPEASLALDARFGQELKANPASDFKANQFDIVDGDIKDVADKRLLKEMAQGRLVIQTVGDYCEHMVRCSRINPEEVARVLRLPATGLNDKE